MSKYVIIPIAGQVCFDLPDDFEGTEDEAFTWAMDNVDWDAFNLEDAMRDGGQWDFYRHISQGNVWYAETPASVEVEEW